MLQVRKTLSLTGKMSPPSSKSQSIRAILFSLMSAGTSSIQHLLDSTDTQDALRICEQLGSLFVFSDQLAQIQSSGIPLTPLESHLYSGNSGITTLFTLPLLGLRKNIHSSIVLDCGEQMRSRPVFPLIDALSKLGMTFEYLQEQGKLPVRIHGQLMGGQTQVDGTISQYLSALLMALPCAPKDSIITVDHLCERPYVEMTLQWLETQGIQYVHESKDLQDIYSIPGRQSYRPFHVALSGDFSSASYFIAAGTLIPGCIEIEGLNLQDPQGDKRLIDILKEMGADISVKEGRIRICGGKPLTGISIDMSDIPDLLPTLAVIGTYASGKTLLKNASHARLKETDRIHSMADSLSRMKANLTEHEDGMTITQSHLQGTSVQGFEDHRTVMALSIAGMLAEGSTLIEDSSAIHKTFPNFVKTMQSLGAQMKVIS